MAFQTWIADALRDRAVPNVFEYRDWKARGLRGRTTGVPYRFNPKGVVVHHTAMPVRPGNAVPSLSLCVNGRAGLRGPICQILIGRDTSVNILAAGQANHAGRGGWRGLSGNSSVLGIEVENDGVGEPWSPELYAATVKVTAALLDHMGLDSGWTCGHKEWRSTKIDPTFNMDDFRADVQRILNGGTVPEQFDSDLVREIQTLCNDTGADPKLVVDGDLGPKTLAMVAGRMHTLKNARVALSASNKSLQERLDRLEAAGDVDAGLAAIGQSILDAVQGVKDKGGFGQ